MSIYDKLIYDKYFVYDDNEEDEYDNETECDVEE